MSLADFFSPLPVDKITPKRGYFTSQLGEKITLNYALFPELSENVDIAIIGVLDGRNTINNEGCASGPDAIREKLYQLNEGAFQTKIVDLGNIVKGKTVSDTYIALKVVVAELIKKNIVPVILGGGQDLTYAQYMAYEELEQNVDLVCIDPYFDIDVDDDSETGGIETTSGSYLNRIILHQPNYLFNYSNISNICRGWNLGNSRDSFMQDGARIFILR